MSLQMKLIIIQVLPQHTHKAIQFMENSVTQEPLSLVHSCPSKGIEHDTLIYAYNVPLAQHFIHDGIMDEIGNGAPSNAVHVTITPKATG